MHSCSVTAAHIAVNNVLLKDSLDYISVADSMGLSSATLTKFAHKATDFGRITQNDDHYVVEGHSRSQILVQNETT